MEDLPRKRQLTPTERRVLHLLALTGASHEPISRALGVAPSTVRVHIQNTLVKMGMHSRTELIAWAWRSGWMEAQGVERLQIVADSFKEERDVEDAQGTGTRVPALRDGGM